MHLVVKLGSFIGVSNFGTGKLAIRVWVIFLKNKIIYNLAWRGAAKELEWRSSEKGLS